MEYVTIQYMKEYVQNFPKVHLFSMKNVKNMLVGFSRKSKYRF